MKYVFLLLSFFLLFPCGAKGQKETSCEIAAFVSDPASGVNIRGEAALKAPVLKTIPADAGGTLVFIDGAKGDWLKISSAVNSRKSRVFSGAGWVYAPLLAIKTSSRNEALIDYFEAPGARRKKIGSIRADFDLNLLGCSGDWIKVSIPMRSAENGVAGWLRRGSYCGSPWEDCL